MSLPLITSFAQQYQSSYAGSYAIGTRLIDAIAVGGRVNIWTLTTDDAAGSGPFVAGDTLDVTVYDEDFAGTVYTVTYTVGSTLDDLTVAQGVRDEWNATLGAASLLTATYAASSGTGVVTLTGTQYNQNMTVAVSDPGSGSIVAAESQTALANEDVEPGRVIVAVGYDGLTRTARRVKSTLFSQLTVTVTVAGLDTAGARLVTRYRYAGSQWWTVSTVMDANNDTTVTNHITALESSFNTNFTAGAGLVAATGGAGIFTVKPDTAGNVFELETSLDGPDTNATVTPVWTGNVDNPTYSFPAALLGISAWKPGTSATTIEGSDAVYRGGQGFPIVSDKWAMVENSQTVAAGELAWIDPTTNPGRVYNAAVSGYLNAWHPEHGRMLSFSGYSNNGTARINVRTANPQ